MLIEVSDKLEQLAGWEVGLAPRSQIFQLAALFSTAVAAPVFSADTFACMNSKR
jgi:hypothetical protein